MVTTATDAPEPDDNGKKPSSFDEAAKAVADNIRAAFNDAAGDVDTYMRNGVIDIEAYTAQVAKGHEALIKYQKALSTARSLRLVGPAFRYVESLGPDALTLIEAYNAASGEQKRQLLATWAVLWDAAQAGEVIREANAGSSLRESKRSQAFVDEAVSFYQAHLDAEVEKAAEWRARHALNDIRDINTYENTTRDQLLAVEARIQQWKDEEAQP